MLKLIQSSGVNIEKLKNGLDQIVIKIEKSLYWIVVLKYVCKYFFLKATNYVCGLKKVNKTKVLKVREVIRNFNPIPELPW